RRAKRFVAMEQKISPVRASGNRPSQGPDLPRLSFFPSQAKPPLDTLTRFFQTLYYSYMNKRPAARRRGPAASDDVMWSLMQAAHAVESQLEEALAQVELSGAKLAALTQLVEADEPVPLGELAARCACVRSNITQLVDRLEADKLVRRVDDAADRRSL